MENTNVPNTTPSQNRRKQFQLLTCTTRKQRPERLPFAQQSQNSFCCKTTSLSSLTHLCWCCIGPLKVNGSLFGLIMNIMVLLCSDPTNGSNKGTNYLLGAESCDTCARSLQQQQGVWDTICVGIQFLRQYTRKWVISKQCLFYGVEDSMTSGS